MKSSNWTKNKSTKEIKDQIIKLTSGLYSVVGTKCWMSASIEPAAKLPSLKVNAWRIKKVNLSKMSDSSLISMIQ